MTSATRVAAILGLALVAPLAAACSHDGGQPRAISPSAAAPSAPAASPPAAVSSGGRRTRRSSTPSVAATGTAPARTHLADRDPRRDRFAGFDWSHWLLPSMSCDAGLVARYGFHASVDLRTDLTGDGVPDYVVVGQCPASTSAWPIMAAVADGASPAGAPRNLGMVSGREYWRTLALSTTQETGTHLVLTGHVVGGDDPQCCAGHRVTLTVVWQAGHFAEVSRTDRHI